MACSRTLRESRISGVICAFPGNGGRFGSIVMVEEDDDSASKRAWRTAESLVVRVDILLINWLRLDRLELDNRGYLEGYLDK